KVDSPGEGKGATFTVTLPLRVSVQDRRLPEPRPDPEPPASLPGLEGLRVVVVDDEDDTRDLMRALLERCGAAGTAAGAARPAPVTCWASNRVSPGPDGESAACTTNRRVGSDQREVRVVADRDVAFAREPEAPRRIPRGQLRDTMLGQAAPSPLAEDSRQKIF